jgi:hypothetical protein
MKKYFVLIISLISIAFLFNACKSNSTSPTDNSTPASGTNYYPNGNGTAYKYSAVKTDSANNKISGSRSVTYSGTTVIGSVTYQNEIDSTFIAGFSTSSVSLFLKNDNGVSIILDTTGFHTLIPAAFQVYAQYISIDQSIVLFQSSFQNGNPWTVYDVALKYNGLSFDLVKVTATYKGMEQVPLNLTTGTVNQSAAKIQYNLTITSPDPTNLFATPTTTVYTAYIWFANNIGIVQVQGNASILDTFTGNGINFADTTGVITESLTSYSIK